MPLNLNKLFSDFREEAVGVRYDSAEYNDFAAFYEAVLGYPIPPYQIQIIPDLLDDSVKRLLILAPPGHSKSTLLGVYAAWLLGHDRNKRIILASHTYDLAVQKVNFIGAIIQSPAYEAIFGKVAPPPSSSLAWNDSRKFVLGRTMLSSDPNLIPMGIEASVLGYRADVIIADDIVSLKNSMTATLRARLEENFHGPLQSRLDSGGRIIVIGSRVYTSDLYGKLKKQPSYKVYEFKATPDKPLWPEHVTAEDLQYVYNTSFTRASAMYKQEPLDQSDALFPVDALRLYTTMPEMPGTQTYMAIDPARKSGIGHDFFVVITGKRIADYVYVDAIEYRHAAESVDEQVESIASWYNRINASLLGIEENSSELLVRLLQERHPELNIKPIQHNLPKEFRLSRLSDHIRSGKILFPGEEFEGEIIPASTIDPIIQEMQQYPKGHDDALDALEMLVQIALYNTTPTAAWAISQEDTQQYRRKNFLHVIARSTKRGRRPRGKSFEYD